jgi:hypothetical protein
MDVSYFLPPPVAMAADGGIIPTAAPQGEGFGMLTAFLSAVGPAAALGALTGQMMADITPKQVKYAKIGAIAGICVVAGVLAVVSARRS